MFLGNDTYGAKTMTKTTIDQFIDTYNARKTAIDARNIPVGTYVLRWANGLFVGVNDATKQGFAAGFENAAFFGDRAAAFAYQRSTQIRNGKNETPMPVLAFNAKQGAMIELDNAIAIVRGKEG
jgi:hypothetical protein